MVQTSKPNLDRDYELCRQIQRRHSQSYYFATCFLPREIRPAVFALYAFVRYPDQWVDCPQVADVAYIQRQLDQYEGDLLRALKGEAVEQAVLRAFADTMRRYEIPLRYPHEFLNAMRMDLSKHRYANLSELQEYMWGSASVVGIMMCYIMGVTDAEAHHDASLMGQAMQMTNFLRDVGEDWQRGRIYLPQDEMEAYGITEAHLNKRKIDDSFKMFMRFQIDRCRRWYRQAEEGICRLPRNAQFAVLLGARLYAQILRCIERQGYDVFRQRAHTRLPEKLLLTYRTFREWRQRWHARVAS